MSQQIAAYDRRTSSAAKVGSYLAGPINEFTNLDIAGAFAGSIPGIGDTLRDGLSELNAQKNAAVSGAVTRSVEMAGSDTVKTFEGYLKQFESSIVSMVMQVTGWTPERAKLGNAMVRAQGMADSAALQGGLARELDEALKGPNAADLPPAPVIAKAVAEGISRATLSGGAMKDDAIAEAKNALQRFIGKEPAAADSRQLSFETASSVHASVFQAAKHHFAALHGGMEKLTAPQQAEAQAYAARTAQKISGLSIDDIEKGSAAVIDQRGGLAGYLNKQLAAIKTGNTVSSSPIELSSTDSPVRPAPTPASSRSPETPAVGA